MPIQKIALLSLAVIFSIAMGFSGHKIYDSLASPPEISSTIPNSDIPLMIASAAESGVSKDIKTTATKKDTRPAPLKIKIPALSIEGSIVRVGLNAKGNMAVPENYKDVAWYGAGTLPGNPGTAIMAGHVNNGLGLSGVFAKLENITVGTEISVTRSDGKEIRFVVSNITLHDFGESTDAIFKSNDGKAHLVLVTCEGSWLEDSKTYNKRLVVHADLVE
jgi:sortase (surface protein transpeptidase)